MKPVKDNPYLTHVPLAGYWGKSLQCYVYGAAFKNTKTS